MNWDISAGDMYYVVCEMQETSLRREGVILGTRSGVLHDNYASLQICTVCEREKREKMSRR